MTEPVPLDHPVTLDDLIVAVRRASPDDVLDQLAVAMGAADHLGELSDHLIGHFVDQARRSGASWTDIGGSMGVTKQAARKRFIPKDPGPPEALDPSQGFHRFTERARNLVVRSQEEARATGQAEIAPAHLVLAVLRDPEATAFRVLVAVDVVPDALADAAAARLPAPVEPVPDLIPYDLEARKVLELGFREALRLQADDVGTEHVLLALAAHEDGEGPLADVGVDHDALVAAVGRVATGP
jgi:hypothetical protein